MNRGQIGVIWCVGILVAIVLFHIGVWMPYKERSPYDARIKVFADIFIKVLHEKPDTKMELLSPITDVIEKTRKERDENQRTWPNYYVGGIGPILILGICAFITAGALKKRD